MDSVSKVEYNARDLSTRSIILFPTRAQVFRDIKDVPLCPGTNEISIIGLTPTVDEHSIKVEGSGAATIIDINVEPLPNHELWDNVYPESESDQDPESEEEIENTNISESAQLVAARLLVRELAAELELLTDARTIAENRQRFMNNYGNSLNSKHHVDIGEVMAKFKTEQLQARRDIIDARGQIQLLEPKLAAAKAEVARLSKLHWKAVSKANVGIEKRRKHQAKQVRKRAQQLMEKTKEKARVRMEREKFWPKYCFAVHIKLEASTFTPASSRRGSVSTSTEIDVVHSVEDGEAEPMATDKPSQTCNLVLSYVTSAAYWSPSYDLQLSTTRRTGVLCFDGQITNNTSETWEKCKVTLSTSQAASSGLEDKAPTITPWHIKLVSNKAGSGVGGGVGGDGSLTRSREEMNHRANLYYSQQAKTAPANRADMFGTTSEPGLATGAPHPPPGQLPAGISNQAAQDYQMKLMFLEQQNKKRLMLSRANQEDTGERAEAQRQQAVQVAARQSAEQMADLAQQQRLRQVMQQQQAQQQQLQQQVQQQQQQQQMQMQQMQQMQMQSQPQPQGSFGKGVVPASGDVLNDFDFDSFLRDDDTGPFEFGAPQLQFQESLIEESGFTTTYDLPGTKTLAPRTHASSHRIARISFASVPFRHTVLAKYRPAAFLSAKLQNDSRFPLLRGPVGVSLDGSFLGRTSLPRCAAGESVSINLGVDPAIVVSYPAPEVSKASKGYFAKEDVRVFERCVRLESKRAVRSGAEPAESKIFVLDQIPVSDDERLRVELIKPEGLVVDGESQVTGIPGRQLRPEDKDWGRASVHLRKNGELNWLVYLNAGKSVKLPLEYQVAVPNGDHAVQA